MLISVVIPVYNVEKYLEKCIESVLAQTFTDYEIILIDDGSTDKCPIICDNYAGKYDFIKVIHKKNGGAAEARNIGTSCALGEYIIYLDSDDYINSNNFFDKLYTKTISRPDLVLYKFKKYHEVNKKTEDCKYSLSCIDRTLNKASIIKELSKRDAFYCSAWSKMVKKSILLDYNIKFKSGMLAEDIAWYYDVLLYVKTFDFIDEAVITYRQRENSVTSSGGEKNLSDNLEILEYWSNKFNDIINDDDLKTSLIGSMGKLYSNLLIGYSNAGKWRKQYKERIKNLSFLLKNSENPRAVIMNKVYKVVGFNGTIAVLEIADKLKR